MAVLAAVSKSILENVGVEISRTLSATSLGGAEWTHSPRRFSIYHKYPRTSARAIMPRH